MVWYLLQNNTCNFFEKQWLNTGVFDTFHEMDTDACHHYAEHSTLSGYSTNIVRQNYNFHCV